MPQYSIIHTDRHGISHYVVSAPRKPTVKEAVAALDIDYEPDREETIEIDLVEVQAMVLRDGNLVLET